MPSHDFWGGLFGKNKAESAQTSDSPAPAPAEKKGGRIRMAAIMDWVGGLVMIGGLAYLGYAYFGGKWPFDGSIMFPAYMPPTMMPPVMMPPDMMPPDMMMPPGMMPPDMMMPPTMMPPSMTCPTGKHWDTAMMKCIPDTMSMMCGTGMHWDMAMMKCVADTMTCTPTACPTGMHWNQAMCKCVAGTCVQNQACIMGAHWDHTLCKCVTDMPMMHKCSKGTRWSPCFRKCRPGGLLEPAPTDPRCMPMIKPPKKKHTGGGTGKKHGGH